MLLVARVAAADPEADAERTFREALARADIAALEQLGAARPPTRWSDDAWSEAARLALRANDFDRARKDLEQVIAGTGAIGSDEQLVRRARAELARITNFAGSAGEWNAVAAEHERLAPAIGSGGDPRPTLVKLEQLVDRNPRYPRAAMVMVLIAQGWERDGEPSRAVAWLERAKRTATSPPDRLRAHVELVHVLIRSGALDAARVEIDHLDASPLMIRKLRDELATARLRRTIRWLAWGVLALLALIAAIALRRAAGSWRAAARRVLRPPLEVLFLVPIGGVLVAIAFTGNPLIARAVLAIVSAGIATSWLSGAILDGQRRPLRLQRIALHVMLAFVAIAAASYLAVDRGHVIDFVIETWRSGMER